ncbi:MAG: hypothetical protein AAGH99_00995 [Planctomycetota bacterium]
MTRRAAEDSSPTPSTFSIAYADDAPSPREVDWPVEDDLAYRAHRLLEEHAGKPLPVEVTLEKCIPTGAGLGGGSSDAAGMIVAVDRLFGLGLNDEDRYRLADELGSDVHFALSALRGDTSAVVSGAGNVIEPVERDETGAIDLVLVLPDFGCPTGPVYAAFDRLVDRKAMRKLEEIHRQAQTFVPSSEDTLFNNLTPAAVEVQPRLKDLLDRLIGLTDRRVHVTGSGAACFVVMESADKAGALVKKIGTSIGVTAIAVNTLA